MKCILYSTQIHTSHSINNLFKYNFIVFFSNDSGLLLLFPISFIGPANKDRIEINSFWVVDLFSDIKYAIGCGH